MGSGKRPRLAVARQSIAARAYSFVYGNVLWPAWEGIARRRTTPLHLSFVERMQWRSPEQIERYQVQALRDLLAYAGARIPYWREVFARARFDAREVRRREDVAALPVLTRDIIRERYADLVDPAHAAVNVKKSTSGSTGAPLRFEYSPESECWRNAVRIRGYSWSGYRPGLPAFFYWANGGSPPTGAAALKVRLDRAMRRETFVDSMKQDEESHRRALARLRRVRPAVIVCYTQSCAQFARWIVDHRLRDWPDVPVICGAEALLASDRATIASAFGPHLFETYGSRETMLLAAECEAHEGMHLMDENVFVEVARGDRAAGAGETGDVLVTDLHNRGMPLIRYQNGDLARPGTTGPCACGRGLRKLDRVEGRRADTLRDREGNAIPGILFHVLFAEARRDLVRQFQAVQRPSGEVVLRVVRGREWSQERFDAVVRRFGEYLRGLPFTVEFREGIPPAPNGKMRTVVVERG
jgi:phenylacetate-CoA ligase